MAGPVFEDCPVAATAIHAKSKIFQGSKPDEGTQ